MKIGLSMRACMRIQVRGKISIHEATCKKFRGERGGGKERACLDKMTVDILFYLVKQYYRYCFSVAFDCLGQFCPLFVIPIKGNNC